MQDRVAKKKASAGALAERVEALEREVAELKRVMSVGRASIGEPGPDDWKLTFGRFKDDPTYEEAERLGRAYRRRQPKC